MSDLVELAREFIEAHEKWEANVLLDDKLWRNGACPFPYYDEAVAVQEKRNRLKAALPAPPKEEE